MERISKVLWGTGLVTLGLAALVHSRQELPSSATLLPADGVVREVRVNRGHYKFRITGTDEWFGYSNRGACENLRGLQEKAAVSLLYAPPTPGHKGSPVHRVFAMEGAEGPLCSYRATTEGHDRERGVTAKLTFILLPLAAGVFFSAVFHQTPPAPAPASSPRPRARRPKHPKASRGRRS